MRLPGALALSCAILSAQPNIAVIDQATREWMATSVGAAKRTVGIAAGVLTPEGPAFASEGVISRNGPRPDQDTLFEIGSLTKIFTALLLADMVERGEVSLNDPVAAYLPATVKVPSRNGREITLADLVSHTSGLPRMPSDYAPDPVNPYAGFDTPRLYEFLNGYTLQRDPGAQWEYSNLGMGLLGHALARHSGTSYEALVKTRILEPLGMSSTTITLDAAQRDRVAVGHDLGLSPVPPGDWDALSSAGAIRSTIADMLTFAAAHMELIDTPLRAAIQRMRTFRATAESPSGEQAMGWLVMHPGGREVLFLNGGTGGFHSAMAVDLDNRRAAVVWVNADLNVDLVAAHLMDPALPLPVLTTARSEIQLSEEALAEYVGVFEFSPGETIAITREGTRLFGQPNGQIRLELFAEQLDRFFLKAFDAQISFEKDSSGKVIRAVLHQNGQNFAAQRIE